MTSNEIKYYENLVDMFLTEGWKQYIEEVQSRVDMISIDSIGSLEGLYKAKGEKDVLTSILGFENMVKQALDLANEA